MLPGGICTGQLVAGSGIVHHVHGLTFIRRRKNCAGKCAEEAALAEIYATATRTLADPPCADMSALIMICTIFETLFAQPEPKPEAGSVQP